MICLLDLEVGEGSPEQRWVDLNEGSGGMSEVGLE